MKLNLLVIRSADPSSLAEFYTSLGLDFEYHRHGTGPMHYSAEVDGFVFEIYPLRQSQTVADASLRLGFTVVDLDKVLEDAEPTIINPPADSAWGYRCVIADPEGRRVELVQA